MQASAAIAAVATLATKPAAGLPIKPEMAFTIVRPTAAIAIQDAKKVMPMAILAMAIHWEWAAAKVLVVKVAVRVLANHVARSAVSATIAVAPVRRAVPVIGPATHWDAVTMVIAVN